ncbi:hypothetical protein T458_13580 [Brevibacillus panacihumi W25]|uniref:Uncharacterized protein n=1 Tax=Brevibacillus panacihumi W25 TaxID=1408254 RepID=V6M8M1_9BACL|nr:hypothetical protein [Brevibacillus panacihumi]EST54607.1 hypothetical protein T458_13580 [Brevibacillus panacihumi W25]
MSKVKKSVRFFMISASVILSLGLYVSPAEANNLDSDNMKSKIIFQKASEELSQLAEGDREDINQAEMHADDAFSPTVIHSGGFIVIWYSPDSSLYDLSMLHAIRGWLSPFFIAVLMR